MRSNTYRFFIVWLIVSAALLAPVFCSAASQSRVPTISEDERLKRAIDAIITYHEKSGDTVLAGRIRQWYAQGYIKLASKSSLNFPSVGISMDEGDPYYWAPTGTIYIPESRLLAAVKPTGVIDFAAITELAGSMAHEMVHANDEGMLSRAFLTSKAEREMSAYTKTLQSYFAGAFKRNADVQKKQGGPCDKAGDAQEVNKMIGEFNRYFDAEIAPKNSARQAPLEAKLKELLPKVQQSQNAFEEQLNKNIGYQSIVKERDAISYEMGMKLAQTNQYSLASLPADDPRLQELWRRIGENERKRKVFISSNLDLAQFRSIAENWRQQYNKANAEYENYLKQDVLFPVDNIRIPRLSYDDRHMTTQLQYERERAASELQRLQKDPSHTNEIMQRISALQDRISELDRQLQTLTVDQARRELETLRTGMHAIIEACEKEKKGQQQTAKPKEEDLLNCLCVACGGTLGGYYSKLGDCAGGCTCWGPLSGWCTPIPTDAKHARNCYGSAYGTKDPSDADVQNLLTKARAENTKATEAAIRKALKDKRLDDAYWMGKEAIKRDPAMHTPAFGELTNELKKQGWNALHKADHQNAIKRLEQATLISPRDADAAKKLSEARHSAAQWPRVEEKEKAFNEFVAAKKVWSAHRTMLEMQDILRPLAAGQSSENPVWKSVNHSLNNAIKWYNEFTQASNAEWTRLFKVQEWEQAETHVKRVLTYELTPADKRHYDSALQLVNSMLSGRKEAEQYYNTAKANFAKGIPPDVQGLGNVIRELKTREGRFTSSDSRRTQIAQLAAAMEKRQKVLNALAYAQIHFNNGDMYYRSYNFEPAAGQYAEGLRAIRENGDMSDPLYAKYYKLWEDSVAKDKRFKELYAYAAGLAVTDKPLDEPTIQKGIAAAEEGLKIRPRNGDMEIHWNKLKWKLGELKRKQQSAQVCEAKWADGKALFNAGKHAEALGKFRENIVCAPGNREREGYVRQLEDSLHKQAAAKQACLSLRQQGDALVQQKKYADAVAKYRESLRCQPDQKLEDYIRTLESSVKQQGTATTPGASSMQTGQSGSSQSGASASSGTVLFDNGNTGGVSNGPVQATVFSLQQKATVTKITTYHWNGGRGAAPGTIGLRSQSGQMYGPWSASGSGGQGGVQNANWHVYPNITLPAGTYTVVVSQPSTWAHNAQSQGRGFARIEGLFAATSVTGASSSVAGAGRTVLAKLTNNGQDNVHIFIEGQETAGPQNRLAPGQSKTITFAPPDAGRVKFVFSRGGRWLGSCYWEYSPDRTPVIRFSEEGGRPRPVCTTHLQ